jgi:hypothetical protein
MQLQDNGSNPTHAPGGADQETGGIAGLQGRRFVDSF